MGRVTEAWNAIAAEMGAPPAAAPRAELPQNPAVAERVAAQGFGQVRSPFQPPPGALLPGLASAVRANPYHKLGLPDPNDAPAQAEGAESIGDSPAPAPETQDTIETLSLRQRILELEREREGSQGFQAKAENYDKVRNLLQNPIIAQAIEAKVAELSNPGVQLPSAEQLAELPERERYAVIAEAAKRSAESSIATALDRKLAPILQKLEQVAPRMEQIENERRIEQVRAKLGTETQDPKFWDRHEAAVQKILERKLDDFDVAYHVARSVALTPYLQKGAESARLSHGARVSGSARPTGSAVPIVSSKTYDPRNPNRFSEAAYDVIAELSKAGYDVNSLS